MANSAYEPFSTAEWHANLVVTAVTAGTDLKAVPASTAFSAVIGGVGAARTRRLVITGYHFGGVNTNAAATIFAIRNKTTTTSVLLNGGMGPTNGSVNVNGQCWLPAAANETLELVVTGALTGSLGITIWGRYLAHDYPAATNYTGAPATP